MGLSPQELVALIVAVSFAAGLNVYATTATLGILSRTGLLTLPTELGLIDDWWVIGVSAALFALEFVLDKVPVVDLLWNALQTFVRVPAGAVLAYGASAPLGLEWQVAAGVGGGAIALAAHGAKTAMRASVTASPEPFSNIGLSLAEDATAIVLLWFATEYPLIAASVVVVLLVIIVVMVRWISRALRAAYRTWREWLTSPSRAR
jgi:hypothetical protein